MFQLIRLYLLQFLMRALWKTPKAFELTVIFKLHLCINKAW